MCEIHPMQIEREATCKIDEEYKALFTARKYICYVPNYKTCPIYRFYLISMKTKH